MLGGTEAWTKVNTYIKQFIKGLQLIGAFQRIYEFHKPINKPIKSNEDNQMVRLLSILEKLSYQSANLVNPNHCPKGQLGQIWANFGQN